MSRNIQHFPIVFYLAFLLNACSGDVLFRTKSCEDGMVRQGNACVAATKAGLGECKDPDLNNLKKGDTVTLCDGSVGEGKLVVPSDCTRDGEQDCVNKSNFKALDSSKIDSAKIANGTIIAGVTGSLRAHKQCRNYSDLATFDSSYPPSNFGWSTITFPPANVTIASDQITFSTLHGLITNSPVQFSTTTTLPSPLVAGVTYYAIYVSNYVIQLTSSANGVPIDITTQGTGTHTAHDVADNTAQDFDTIDDNNNNQAFSPAKNPWSSNDYLCDASNFVNVTSTSAPLLPSGLTPATGNQPFTQIWQDQISGMYISNILSVSGGLSWSDARRTCESLNGGTAGDGWRLPTQKEQMQLYVHGISKVALAGGNTTALFWSSTGSSISNSSARTLNLSYGTTGSSNRFTTTNSTLCIR